MRLDHLLSMENRRGKHKVFDLSYSEIEQTKKTDGESERYVLRISDMLSLFNFQ